MLRFALKENMGPIIALVLVLLATGRGADVARAMAILCLVECSSNSLRFFLVPDVCCGFLEMKMKGGLGDSRCGFVSKVDENATFQILSRQPSIQSMDG